MLSHYRWVDRSFDAIRKKVVGFSDDDIKLLLHEVEAKKSTRDVGNEEWWYFRFARKSM